jgi:hypothetical protein
MATRRRRRRLDAGGDEESGPKPRRSAPRCEAQTAGADSRRNSRRNCRRREATQTAARRCSRRGCRQLMNEFTSASQVDQARRTIVDASHSERLLRCGCCLCSSYFDAPHRNSSRCQASQSSPPHASTTHTHDAATQQRHAALPNDQSAKTHAAICSSHALALTS